MSLLSDMSAKAIFGGSFDPPTNAHTELVKNLSLRFDEVIVVPAYVSPFKRGGALLDGRERIKLLKRLFSDLSNVVVSDYELSMGGTSYSYKTALNFYDGKDKLYFVIGSDGLSSLDKWARTDILKETVIFYVVERPYFPVKAEALQKAKKMFDVQLAPFQGLEGSSSLLRAAVAFGKQAEIVPGIVADYIAERGLYREYEYITARYDEFDIKPSRREHIYRTAKAAIILAKLNGADTDKTTRAALLHDIGKYVGPERLKALGIDCGKEADALPESCRHQITGAAIAEKLFKERDKDVLAAIRTHTTGAERMSLLQKIIFAADYIEDGRDFMGINEIRAAVYDNLDRGIKLIFENTIDYLRTNGQEIAPVTLKAYEYLKSLQEKI